MKQLTEANARVVEDAPQLGGAPTGDRKFWPLGYSSAWVELGIVTEQEIEHDAASWHRREEPFAEHYRSRRFFQFLQARSPLPAELARGLYEMAAADSDPVMAGTMMSMLLRRPECPPDLLLAAANSDRTYLREISARRLAEASEGNRWE